MVSSVLPCPKRSAIKFDVFVNCRIPPTFVLVLFLDLSSALTSGFLRMPSQKDLSKFLLRNLIESTMQPRGLSKLLASVSARTDIGRQGISL